MALNFPLNPSDGDTYQGYVYDATDGVWNANQGQIVSRFSTSATQPSSPSAGDGWFNPSNGKTYIYYDGAWVESGNPVIGGIEPYDKQTSATGYFALPSGTTAQRPDTPQNGDIRFNTTLGEPEYYNETLSTWFRFREIPVIEFSIEYLVIAGGGGAGGNAAGGGGAGGYRSSINGEDSGGGSSSELPISASTGDSVVITIGAGGAGGSPQGVNGNNTVFSSVTCLGGGFGGGYNDTNGGSGGSGGGMGGSISDGGPAGSGTSNQGYAGGSGVVSGTESARAGGGGGGAGQAGVNAGSGDPGEGGNGLASSVTGSSVYRAGGGGGSTQFPVVYAAGGLGGGGTNGSSGSVNTGSGGGGNQGAGGSGIVILKYPSSRSLSVGDGLTYSTATVGDYKVTQFTAGTDTVTFS